MKLFTETTLGRLQLRNRVVMAPMTRSRADQATDVPTDLMREYYQQRASAGLIITEGTQPSAEGKGYCRTPGIYTAEQIAAWKTVTSAVHAEGGQIVLQLMHCGRVASSANKGAGVRTVAPSAITANAEIFTEQGMLAMDEPEAMSEADILQTIDDYRRATENAYAAGFDGVELHCTSGYLPAQFLSTGTNQRSDDWGGSLENRLRFVLEVLKAMTGVDGSDRVGMRICPGNPFNDLHDDNHEETFAALLRWVDPMQLAYLHVIRMPQLGLDNIGLARANYSGALIVNESYDRDEAESALDEQIQAVSFGRPFIANPDLVRRYREGLALSQMNPKTLYTPGEAGYTDYPTV
ncbi:N-ethylmaleimide reductase [Litorivivens lipolytica]|uniref:N-ethylmaleimide reductase n=2 Tax=Litorivivens lipolytica TaxID=1524264 RepID=A0A7W4W5W5_9GAMM|nr:alkene reductase [Litorivivens lipolytica]MBB3047668.1 N-ethylmaleimide reductase [Litorivivens lipolytica]